MVIRPQSFNYEPPAAYERQLFTAKCPVEMETMLRALHRVARKADEYRQVKELWEEFLAMLKEEIGKTYLGEFFRIVREKLDNKLGAAN